MAAYEPRAAGDQDRCSTKDSPLIACQKMILTPN